MFLSQSRYLVRDPVCRSSRVVDKLSKMELWLIPIETVNARDVQMLAKYSPVLSTSSNVTKHLVTLCTRVTNVTADLIWNSARHRRTFHFKDKLGQKVGSVVEPRRHFRLSLLWLVVAMYPCCVLPLRAKRKRTKTEGKALNLGTM